MWLEIILVLVLLVLWERFSIWRVSKILPNIPRVTNVPLIGTSMQLLEVNPENMHLTFQKYGKLHGKTYYAFPMHTIYLMTSDYRHMEPLLQSSRNIRKSFLYEALDTWLGDGLLISHGKHWQTMRKIITPTFHFKILEEFVEVFDRQSSTFVEKIKPFADGKTVVDVYPFIGLLTLDVIAETAMGVPVNAQQNSKADFVMAVKDVTEILALRFTRPLYFPTVLLALFAPKTYMKQQKAIRATHDFTEKIIEDRRAKLQDSQTQNNTTTDDIGQKKRMALLDVLLQSTIEGKPLTNKQICDEVNTFMFEGHDTTNAAAAFTLYLLSRHPKIQQKLFEEIRSYFGDDLSRPITYSDLLQLNYLNCVVKEALRLYPSVPAIGRKITETMKINDLTLPSGSNVIMVLWQMLRDPDVFTDPEKFIPERFMDENSKMNAFSNIPFSAGPRNCIGQRFALFEMKTIVIKTLRNYELLDMGEEVKLNIKITLSSSTGVNMGLQKRVY